MDIKDEYARLRKKFKTLPSFDALDTEFEISMIENHPTFLLREIRKKMTERIEFFAKVLEELLQPEATMANLRESKDFTDKEKQEMFELYKKLMMMNRTSMEFALTGSDKDNVAFIIDVTKEWDKAKKQLLIATRKMKHSWTKNLHFEEEQSYFG